MESLANELICSQWQWAFGVYTIMTGLCWFAQMVFGDETYFNRKISIEKRPARTPGFKGQFQRLVGIEQWRSRYQRSTFGQAVMRPVRVLMKPTVFISTLYYLLTFAWYEHFMTEEPCFSMSPALI